MADKLLITRSSDVKSTFNNNKKIKSVFNKFESSSDPKKQRIHVENVNPNGRTLRGKYSHMHLITHVTNYVVVL